MVGSCRKLKESRQSLTELVEGIVSKLRSAMPDRRRRRDRRVQIGRTARKFVMAAKEHLDWNIMQKHVVGWHSNVKDIALPRDALRVICSAIDKGGCEQRCDRVLCRVEC